jgi:cytochrome oxidase Cu insertion factor (SCO1/SenC/PrrC family)
MLGTARTGISEFLILAILAAALQVLPRPQITSAESQPAPNFALKNQHGKTVGLSSMHGKRVLLIFFRGYW